MPRTAKYDAFISYSHADKEFAIALEKALEAYKPPKDLDVPQRRLKIFRDESDLTGPDLPQALKANLRDSTHLIVLCSPDARESDYVNDEIREFVRIDERNAKRIIPIWLSGILNHGAESEQESQKAFPNALCEVLSEPLGIQYVGCKPKKGKLRKGNFEASWYTVLAGIFEKDKAEIEQRDRRRAIAALVSTAYPMYRLYMISTCCFVLLLISMNTNKTVKELP